MGKPDYRIEKVVGEEYSKYSSVELSNEQYDCFLNFCLCVDVDDCESYIFHESDCNKYCPCVTDGKNQRDVGRTYWSWKCDCDSDDSCDYDHDYG